MIEKVIWGCLWDTGSSDGSVLLCEALSRVEDDREGSSDGSVLLCEALSRVEDDREGNLGLLMGHRQQRWERPAV
ncbi:UNVERIFIED_CONTAM: hypothetical protein FKN15_038515 [Acipenser sinensis]